MANADSVKFRSIFTQVENLHQLGMDDHSRAEAQFSIFGWRISRNWARLNVVKFKFMLF